MKMKQHVQLPNDMTMCNNVIPRDLLIYASIKRYMNKETKEAFPSLATLSKVSGCSVNVIRSTIENLVKLDYISIRKEGRKNIYLFNSYKEFEPFSYDFLDKEDLTWQEKAYIIASQQFMFKENGEGKISYNNREMAEKLNISEKSVSRYNDALERKNYLSIIQTNAKKDGVIINEKFFHLDELGQAVVFILQDHDKKINENTKDIEELKKDMKILMRENEELKNKFNETRQITL